MTNLLINSGFLSAKGKLVSSRAINSRPLRGGSKDSHRLDAKLPLRSFKCGERRALKKRLDSPCLDACVLSNTIVATAVSNIRLFFRLILEEQAHNSRIASGFRCALVARALDATNHRSGAMVHQVSFPGYDGLSCLHLC